MLLQAVLRILRIMEIPVWLESRTTFLFFKLIKKEEEPLMEQTRSSRQRRAGSIWSSLKSILSETQSRYLRMMTLMYIKWTSSMTLHSSVSSLCISVLQKQEIHSTILFTSWHQRIYLLHLPTSSNQASSRNSKTICSFSMPQTWLSHSSSDTRKTTSLLSSTLKRSTLTFRTRTRGFVW